MKRILFMLLLIGTLLATASCNKQNEQKTEIVTKEYFSSDEMGLNPFLPLYEYIPDGEPHVFGDRVYIYGSHDKAGGDTFCMNDYVVYSANIDNLEEWHFDGCSYAKEQDPRYAGGAKEYLYAPDVVKGKDGKYYLFYCLNPHPEIGVAVSDNPEGPFEYYGLVKHSDGTPLGQGKDDLNQFDPAVFIDEDGSIYLYSGNANRHKGKNNNQGSQVMTLEDDMLTLKTEPEQLLCTIDNSEGTGFEGHEFFEASSMRKINDTYYLIYCSVNLHELCYAYSDSPNKDFKYGGVIISNIDVFADNDGNTIPLNDSGNNHGSIECINDQWYIFYHRHTNGRSYSRQACAERIYIEEDGSIPQVEITTTGMSSISGKTADWISAGRACNLAANFNAPSDAEEADAPYITQTGRDRESDPFLYVKNIVNYSLVGFKYFNCDGVKSITISVGGDFEGTIEILDSLDGSPKGNFTITSTTDWTEYTADVSDMSEDSAIYFHAKGTGTLQFEKFKINYE